MRVNRDTLVPGAEPGPQNRPGRHPIPGPRPTATPARSHRTCPRLQNPSRHQMDLRPRPRSGPQPTLCARLTPDPPTHPWPPNTATSRPRDPGPTAGLERQLPRVLLRAGAGTPSDHPVTRHGAQAQCPFSTRCSCADAARGLVGRCCEGHICRGSGRCCCCCAPSAWR